MEILTTLRSGKTRTNSVQRSSATYTKSNGAKSEELNGAMFPLALICKPAGVSLDA